MPARVATDGGFDRVPLSDWGAVETHLRRFAVGGHVDRDDDRVSVDVGSAHVTVTRDGRVEAGMPLHAFEAAAIEALYIDDETGRLQIRDDDALRYEFRRP
jgi:hypothetical protein